MKGLFRASILASVALLSSGTGACRSDSCGDTQETFVSYVPGVTTSAIPLCTSATAVADGGSGLFASGPAPGFPAAASLSAAAVAECQATCGQGGTAVPCCVSMWEPDTVLCEPSCIPN